MKDLLEKAAEAATEAAAVDVLIAGGYHPADAREVAAIMFGRLKSDVIESDVMPEEHRHDD